MGISGVSSYSSNSLPTLSGLLRNGSRGASVRTLQQALKAAGFDPGPADGIFGNKTRTAVLAFQRAKGLAADGIVGSKTWAALSAATSSPAPTPPLPPEDTVGGTHPSLEPIPAPGGSGVGVGEEPAAAMPRTVVRTGARGAVVSLLQHRLSQLGHSVGPIDGIFGNKTRSAVIAFQRQHGLSVDGIVGPQTWSALERPGQTPSVPSGPTTVSGEYTAYAAGAEFPPFSAEATALFEAAAELIGVPRSWASAEGLHHILRRESNGKVGIPNYTYEVGGNLDSWERIHDELKRGRISARSSATGLGQLLLANVDAHYPSGRQGIGIPLEEAAGMLSYIRSRYGSPEAAWTFYTDPNKPHEGY